ncbi:MULTISPECIES: hypothetical protein [unclassified Mesorhizobium]|uniref:hypothetical protein n=1 Tax=unclassified Mesorhizobium TaxID=325217 RepID=UPI001FF01D09|nr:MULTISPECIES: hypothetical protein [unclassified Mesorhizobium]
MRASALAQSLGVAQPGVRRSVALLARVSHQAGPFTPEAPSLGDFWGIRVDGRLAAMAGERMKQPGCSEFSGVQASGFPQRRPPAVGVHGGQDRGTRRGRVPPRL